MRHMPLTPALGGQSPADLWKFESVEMGYTVRSRTVGFTYLDSFSKNKTKLSKQTNKQNS